MSEKIVYLMRGLPSCGKSHTARKLAGTSGVVCETDEYFYTQVGDDPARFDYREELMEQARRWNFQRFQRAIDEGVTPVVVDRGNSRSSESKIYAQYAIDHGYTVELREPESEWWQEIRVLLKYKRLTKPALYEWADRLSTMNSGTHRVPASTIRRWMDKWRWDLTVEEILAYEPPPRPQAPVAEPVPSPEPPEQPDPDAAEAVESAQPVAEQSGLSTAQNPGFPHVNTPAEDARDLLPTEDDVLLQDSPLKPGERSPFL